MTAQQLDLLDDGRRRVACPRCGRLHCLTGLGLLYGHGPRNRPCPASWQTERAARLAARAARGGAR